MFGRQYLESFAQIFEFTFGHSVCFTVGEPNSMRKADMDNQYKKIVLVTDALSTSMPTVETAFNLAKQHGAEVLIVDTLREPSTIAKWFSSNSEDLFEMVLADKQKRLENIAQRFKNAGIEAGFKVLFGKSSEAITLAAIEEKADLVIRNMKGANSRYPGMFGNTSRNLMRFCPCPTLFVGETAVESPNLVACINAEDAVDENEAILRAAEQMTAGSKQLQGVYCWDLHGKEIMEGHVSSETIERLLEESKKVHKSILDRAIGNMELGEFEDGVQMLNGDPRKAIPQFCRDQSINVAVMCSASLNHPLQRLLGSTIESILDDLPCALLVVKPAGFVSPVASAESEVEVA